MSDSQPEDAQVAPLGCESLTNATDSEPELIGFFSQEFQGPLPPPDVLEGYSNAVKDGAERVFRMAEQVVASEVGATESYVRATDRMSKSILHDTWLKHGVPLVVVVAIAALAVVLVVRGEPAAGVWLGAADLVFPLLWVSLPRLRRPKARVPFEDSMGD